MNATQDILDLSFLVLIILSSLDEHSLHHCIHHCTCLVDNGLFCLGGTAVCFLSISLQYPEKLKYKQLWHYAFVMAQYYQVILNLLKLTEEMR